MLAFFPTPYKDEILYSVCSRYHSRAGNIHHSVTMKELFGETYKSSKLLLPTSLNYLEAEMPPFSKITALTLLNNNTPYNYFKTFLQKDRRNNLKAAMLSNNSKNASSISGLVKDLTKFKFLRFCPECIKADMHSLGESYWHIVHQIPCVHICPYHGVPTENSEVPINDLNKSSYSLLDEESCLNKQRTYFDEYIREKLHLISLKILECLNLDYDVNLNIINEVYNDYLIYKGYMHPSGRLYREKITIDFINFYGSEVLDLLGYQVILEKKNNWFFRLIKNPKEEGNPIRHILLMLFLGISFDFKINNDIKYLPFGLGPWYCLNPACEHYKTPSITNIELKFDSRNDNVAANFKCECGFKYTRHAPYDEEKDRYSYKYILEYGSVWDNKLTEMATDGNHTLKDTYEYLKCSNAVVIRNLQRLGVVPHWAISDIYSTEAKEFTSRATKHQLKDKHRNVWIKAQINNPSFGISDLIDNFKGTYKWLNKNDNEWLFENSPEAKPTVSNYHINWEERDSFLHKQFIDIIERELQKTEIPIRLTKTYLFAKSNLRNISTIDINKVPKTKKLIEERCETIEEYHLRRLKWASEYVFNNGLAQTYENIFYHAKIGQNYFNKYKNIINCI